MYILTNFLLFCAINAFTPGPGNLLVMNVAAARGFKDGRPLFCGVFAGYFAVQSLSAVLTLLLSSRLPSMLSVMKYLGAVYIVWLAVRLVRSRPQAGADGRHHLFGAFFYSC